MVLRWGRDGALWEVGRCLVGVGEAYKTCFTYIPNILYYHRSLL